MPNSTPDVSEKGSAMSTVLTVLAAAFAVMLLIVSYRFEEYAYEILLGDVGASRLLSGYDLSIAQAMAMGFGAAKVGCVFVLSAVAITGIRSVLVSVTSRVILFVLSVFASLLITATYVVSPGAQTELDRRLSEVHANYNSEVSAVRSGAQILRSSLTTELRQNEVVLRTPHLAEMERLNALLDIERLNGGQNFDGARYQELEQMLATELARYQAELEALRMDHANKTTELDATQAEQLIMFRDERDSALEGLDLATIANSPEAQNPGLLRLQSVLNNALPENWQIGILTLTILLSGIVALAVELAPFLLLMIVFEMMERPALAHPRQQIATPPQTQTKATKLTINGTAMNIAEQPITPPTEVANQLKNTDDQLSRKGSA